MKRSRFSKNRHGRFRESDLWGGPKMLFVALLALPPLCVAAIILSLMLNGMIRLTGLQ